MEYSAKVLRNFAFVLILAGIFFLLITLGLIYQRTTSVRLAFASVPQDSQISSINTSQTPNRIIINSINVDLPVVPSKIENGKWQVTSRGVSYLTTSALPGEVGNAVFYGHNWQNLLGKLPEVNIGDKITIVYDDYSMKTFIVNIAQEVTPLQTDVLEQSGDKRITVYTCSGFLDSKRFVVVAIAE